jgi:SAM-dependent methyltransferase
VSAPEAAQRVGPGLLRRYGAGDLGVFDESEAKRFLSAGADPQADPALAWELVYRLEPDLYDRLATAERLHPAVLDWLPDSVGRIVEVGAGSGRLTLELLGRANELVAVEPAQPLRAILEHKLHAAPTRCSARVVDGYFDALPVPDDWADLVLGCSAFTPAPEHGGDAGLIEMERVCRPGGCVALVWPNALDYLASRGYEYVSFEGDVFVEFASGQEAAELIEIFYPNATDQLRATCDAWRSDSCPVRVAYDELGLNAPRDVSFKVVGP